MEKFLVLASASPRRSEILLSAGYEFNIITSAATEITEGAGAIIAAENAKAKALAVYSQQPENAVVLGADTVVCLNDKVLGKPKSREDAFNMLVSLSDSNHSVITGYAVASKNGVKTGYCETFVKFRPLTDEEINDYVATGECDDKAGAYGIQERASLFVEAINGDYFNIMGLPVAEIYPILKSEGIYPKWQKVLV
ncbi:MAG: septum formation protein Maf [Clostridia bacterium]|nr:septum formation protein Maf [Clostridia bacterium]